MSFKIRLRNHLIRSTVGRYPHSKAIKDVFREVIREVRDNIDREANDSTVWGDCEALFLEVMAEELPNAYAVLAPRVTDATGD